jgi:hypothetical protein
MIDLFVVICSCVFVCSAAMAVKGSTSSGVSIAEIKALLFRAGDRVILPSTPTHARVGASPLRTTMSAHKHGLGLGAAVSPRANRQPTSSLFSPQAIPASVHTNTNIQAQAQAQAPAFASPLVRTQAIVPTSAAAVSRHHSTPMIAHTQTPPTSTQSSALAQKSVSTQSYLMSASKLNNIPFSQSTHTDTQLSDANTHTAVSTQSSDTNTPLQANAIAYGHAVANGWRSAMEDRISVHCPLTVTLSNPHTHKQHTDTDTHTGSTTHTDVSTHADTPIADTASECVYNIDVGLFGVIDGHDGSGSAQFLATHLGDVFRSVCTHILTETWTQADCPCTQTHAHIHTETHTPDAAAMDVQPTHTQTANTQLTANTQEPSNTHGSVFRAMQESPDLWRRILHVVCERLEELLEAEPMMAVKIKDPGYVCCV